MLPNKLFCCCFLPYCAKRLVCQASVALKCFVLCQLFGSLASAWRNCRENTQRIPQSENSSLLGGPANPYRKLYQSPTTVLGKSCSKLSKLCFSKRFVFASSKWTLLVLQTWCPVVKYHTVCRDRDGKRGNLETPTQLQTFRVPFDTRIDCSRSTTV